MEIINTGGDHVYKGLTIGDMQYVIVKAGLDQPAKAGDIVDVLELNVNHMEHCEVILDSVSYDKAVKWIETNKPAQKCNFAASCKGKAEFIVIHKAVMKMPQREVPACKACASKIGSKAPGGPVIDMPAMESRFYKLARIV